MLTVLLARQKIYNDDDENQVSVETSLGRDKGGRETAMTLKAMTLKAT